jgi:hypothetical protein
MAARAGDLERWRVATRMRERRVEHSFSKAKIRFIALLTIVRDLRDPACLRDRTRGEHHLVETVLIGRP